MKTKLPFRSSSAPYISTRTPMSRRHFLRGTGVALALPMLDLMRPVFGAQGTADAPQAPGAKPRRFFAVCNNLGLLPTPFFPTGVGRDYVASPYLQLLQDHRQDFTVFSGVALPGVDSGHPGDICFLTGAPHPSSASFHNTISLDQYIADQIGTQTRFPSITLAVNTRSRSLSYSGTGVAVPPEDKAAEVFKQLFVQGSPAEVDAQVLRLDTGRSILDTIGERAAALQRKAGAADRERLDEYFTSVRDLESRLHASQGWEKKPKPVVEAAMPVDPASPAQYMAKVKVMYDLARLAFQTDSTRTITLMLDSVATPVIEGLTDVKITEGYHNLSHHGKSPDKLGQLTGLDTAHMKLLARLYADFKAVREGEESLLDRTMVLYGSNLGDANTHVNTNMPVIFAGGGFKHGQHLAFDTTPERNYPLSNLYVSILQRLGLNQDRFSSSTGSMKGLETT
jgi:hypothetical protein